MHLVTYPIPQKLEGFSVTLTHPSMKKVQFLANTVASQYQPSNTNLEYAKHSLTHVK